MRSKNWTRGLWLKKETNVGQASIPKPILNKNQKKTLYKNTLFYNLVTSNTLLKGLFGDLTAYVVRVDK